MIKKIMDANLEEETIQFIELASKLGFKLDLSLVQES